MFCSVALPPKSWPFLAAALGGRSSRYDETPGRIAPSVPHHPRLRSLTVNP
jgi:hypothetical protein